MLSVTVAQALVSACAFYVLIGLVVAIGFVGKGAGNIDPSASAGSLGFKLLILPGCIALWPLVAMMWRRGHGIAERNAHRDKANASS